MGSESANLGTDIIFLQCEASNVCITNTIHDDSDGDDEKKKTTTTTTNLSTNANQDREIRIKTNALADAKKG